MWYQELKRSESGRPVMPILYGDLIFYITNKGIMLFDTNSQESRLIVENENAAYLSNVDGGFLYFSLGDKDLTLRDNSIYRVSLNEGIVELVYTHPHWDFGFRVLNSKIYIYEFWEIFQYDIVEGYLESIFSYDHYLSLVFTEDWFFFISFSQRDASIYKKSRYTGEVRLMRGAGDVRLLEEDADNEVFIRYIDLMLINGDVYYIARKNNSFLIGKNDIIILDMTELRIDTEHTMIDLHWFSDGLNLFYSYIIYNSHNSKYTTFIYAYDAQSNKSILLTVIENFRLSTPFGIFDDVLIYDGYPGYLKLILPPNQNLDKSPQIYYNNLGVMIMPKTYTITSEMATAIRKEMKVVKCVVAQKRMEAVALRGEGKNNREIAEIKGYHARAR